MASIEFIDIKKSWAKAVAIEHASFSVGEGEFIVIVGPSGCGKTTLLTLLAGLYRPTEGEVHFDGVNVNEVEARFRNIGLVFQSYALYPHLTARENISFPLRYLNLSKVESDRRIAEIANLVQIEGLLERRPSEMSGGQQQRVALARALIKRPNVLLLDEPLSNLDAALRLHMRTEIMKLQRKLSVTTVMVTHDQTEALTLADRIVVMNKGRVEQVGTPDVIYNEPATSFVARFIGSPPMNVMPADVIGGRLVLGGHNFGGCGAADGIIDVGFRPENVSIGDNGLAGTVTALEKLGRELVYYIETPEAQISVLETNLAPKRSVGDRVHIDLDMSKLAFFSQKTGRRITEMKSA